MLDGFGLQDDDQESMIMPNKDGQKFQCFLPKVVKVKTGKLVNQHNTSSVIVETEKRVKPKTPDEMLEVLKDRCFIRVRIFSLTLLPFLQYFQHFFACAPKRYSNYTIICYIKICYYLKIMYGF